MAAVCWTEEIEQELLDYLTGCPELAEICFVREGNAQPYAKPLKKVTVTVETGEINLPHIFLDGYLDSSLDSRLDSCSDSRIDGGLDVGAEADEAQEAVCLEVVLRLRVFSPRSWGAPACRKAAGKLCAALYPALGSAGGVTCHETQYDADHGAYTALCTKKLTRYRIIGAQEEETDGEEQSGSLPV